MKTKKLIITAALLSLTLIAGCASNSAQETTAVESAPETIAAAPETTVPAETVPETEATEAPAEAGADFVVEITPVITEEQNQVAVAAADEFLAAIAPNTEILLNAELIDLSEATGYGETDGAYYYWNDGYDGPELRIANVSNLTIRGSGEDHGANVRSQICLCAHL